MFGLRTFGEPVGSFEFAFYVVAATYVLIGLRYLVMTLWLICEEPEWVTVWRLRRQVRRRR